MRGGLAFLKTSLFLAGVLLCGGLVACGTSAKRLQGGAPPPTWLDHLPPSKSEICAVGVSGPTYYPQDALGKSKSAALTELGRAVQVKVTSELTMKQRESTGSQSGVSVQELSTFMSQAVLKLAQVRGQWTNPGGYSSRGEPGTTYTLVCMPLNVSTAELQESAHEITPVANPRLPLLIQESETVLKGWRQ